MSLLEIILVGWDLNGGRQSNHEVDWEAVERRARSHPREAREMYKEMGAMNYEYVDYYPLNFLALCRGPTLGAVEAVYEAFPRVVTNHTDDGYPLEAYMSGGSDPEVARFLLKKELEWRKKLPSKFRFAGRNPIIFCCSHNTDTSIVEALLEEYPLAASQAGDDDSPIISVLSNIRVDEDAAGGGAPDEFRRYKKLKLFLMCIEHGTVIRNELSARGVEFMALHSFLRCISSRLLEYDPENMNSGVKARVIGDILDRRNPSPGGVDKLQLPEMPSSLNRILHLLRDEYPDQFRERDHTGKLPLEVVIEAGAPTLGGSSLLVADNIYRFLLGVHPPSASTLDSDGLFPLHRAAENEWPVDAILDSYPTGITTPHPTSGLFPFQIAASVGSVELSYKLLRRDPSTIKLLVRPC